jgi:hypothetical protein
MFATWYAPFHVCSYLCIYLCIFCMHKFLSSFANCSQFFFILLLIYLFLHLSILISFSKYSISFQLLHLCRPSDSSVSDDAGIEPRTAATSALAVRRSKHWAIQYLIHTRLDLIHKSAECHPYPARSHLHSVRSHPQLG